MTEGDPRPPQRIVVLVGYAGVQSLDLVGPAEVFAMANKFSGRRHYEVILASEDGGELVTESGLRIAGCVPLALVPENADTILVGGAAEEALRALQLQTTLPSWVRARAGTTRRIGSICSGAFVLAAAGLLDGRRATTHWGACAHLKSFRPEVILEPDAIFVADPPIYTSAGITAGIDLCLSLVEADCGPGVAYAVAKNLVLLMRRAGGQSQFSVGLNVQLNATSTLRRLVGEIIANPVGDLSLAALANRSGMTERTFRRTFRRETGASPAAFVELTRLERAKALLETADWPLERIAERGGFGSTDALHRAFRKRLNLTPSEYRARFTLPAAG